MHFDEPQLFLLIKSFTVPVTVLDPHGEEWQVPSHSLAVFYFFIKVGMGLSKIVSPTSAQQMCDMSVQSYLKASLYLRFPDFVTRSTLSLNL